MEGADSRACLSAATSGGKVAPRNRRDRGVRRPYPPGSFSEVALWAREGLDYGIALRPMATRIAVLAIHGGGIESGTSEVAKAIAGQAFSLYCFEGLKERGNHLLHVTSTRFDEPSGIRLAEEASVIVSIHACRDLRSLVYVGGLHRPLMERLVEALMRAGFAAQEDDTIHSGSDPRNICNRGRSSRGVQLELSVGLRRRLFEGLSANRRRKVTPLFPRFTEAIAGVLVRFERESAGP
jgi:phage replication-related protein YjqB (UPF0714/DUF867 family)